MRRRVAELEGALFYFATIQDCTCSAIEWEGMCCHKLARAALSRATGEP